MIEKEKLKDYASKLMFDMKDSEYETLQQEFEVILKQMDLIGKIKDIAEVEPMTFPFSINDVKWRKDEVKDTLSIDDLMKNAKDTDRNQIRVPKVVE